MSEPPLEVSAPTPVGAMVCAVAAVGALLLAVLTGSPHWAVFAVLPALIAVAAWLARPRGFSGRLTLTTLEVNDPPSSIPYESMTGLVAPKHKPGRPFAMSVIYPGGVVHIPAGPSVDAPALYRFFLEHIPPRGGRSVNTALADYLQRQEELFGAERVWSYVARTRLVGAGNPRRRVLIALAVCVTGIVWAVLGFKMPNGEGWGVFGIIMALFGLLFAFLFWKEGDQVRGVKNWRRSCLVISPVGLALVQGDLKGEMRWDELRDVKMGGNEGQLFTVTSETYQGTGILLVVAGASIVIRDIYDRPLPLILEQINRYWKRDGLAPV